MADFKTVFSTTAKVWISLLIISLLIGIGVLAFGGILASLGLTTRSSNSTSTARFSDSAFPSETDIRKNAADARRTSMPKSVWDAGVARAIKEDCITDGMNQLEVSRAWGEPTKKEPSSWAWDLRPGACTRYDGDNCVKREERNKIVFFTANGNVYNEGEGCGSFNEKNEYIYERGRMFPSLAKPN